MAISQQTKPLSIFKILCEAFKLPTKNLKLTLSILLLYFLYTSLLPGALYLSTNPIFGDLKAKFMSIASIDPSNPEYAIIYAAIVKDLKEIFCIEAIFNVAYYIISSLLEIATIQAFSLASSGKPSTVKDLLCRLGNRLKGPMITKLYVSFLSLGYTFLLFSVVGIFVSIARGSMVLITSGVILALLWLILYVYLVMVWSVSVVISVVENDCYGLDAISKATETVRGRRKQGALLVLILYVIIGVFVITAVKFTAYSMWIRLVYALVGASLFTYEMAVFVVFYWDCKRSNGGDGLAMINGGFMYVRLPTAAHDEIYNFHECKV